MFDLILSSNRTYQTRNAHNIPQYKTKHIFFKNSFFPSTILKWNKLDVNIRNSETLSVFFLNLLNFVRPSPKKHFDRHIPNRIKYITRLRLRLSHFRKHKFKHNFQNALTIH